MMGGNVRWMNIQIYSNWEQFNGGKLDLQSNQAFEPKTCDEIGVTCFSTLANCFMIHALLFFFFA